MQEMIEAVYKKLATISLNDLIAIIESPDTPVYEKVIAKGLYTDLLEGGIKFAEHLENRLIGQPELKSHMQITAGEAVKPMITFDVDKFETEVKNVRLGISGDNDKEERK